MTLIFQYSTQTIFIELHIVFSVCLTSLLCNNRIGYQLSPLCLHEKSNTKHIQNYKITFFSARVIFTSYSHANCSLYTSLLYPSSACFVYLTPISGLLEFSQYIYFIWWYSWNILSYLYTTLKYILKHWLILKQIYLYDLLTKLKIAPVI